MKNPRVSIIIPTRNSAIFLENTLKSIKNQNYKNIEIIIVDGKSTDDTIKISKKYRTTLYTFVPKVAKGVFDAPHKRNFGAKKAKGEFVYYVDADMELSKNVVKEAVELCQKGFDGVIIREDSFGKGVWAKAKNLERRCYWGDDLIEAPRFFNKKIWLRLGGLDEKLGGGGDDWDLYQKMLKKNYKVGRIKGIVRHNEGSLSLMRLMKKRFMYGRDSFKYLKKRPVAGAKSYFPIRPAYIRHWRLFVSRPVDTLAFIYMRTVEYCAGLAGVIYGNTKK